MATSSFWLRAMRYPPCLVRLLARHPHGDPLSDGEIAQRSGLSRYQVGVIASSVSWDEITLGDMRRFLNGCGIDFCDAYCMKKVSVYLNGVRIGKCKMSKYLRKARNFKTELEHLIRPAMTAVLNWNKQDGTNHAASGTPSCPATDPA